VFKNKASSCFKQNIIVVVENRVLRIIFGPNREEGTEQQRKLHTKKLHNMRSSLNIIRTMKSRRMRCAGHVASMGEM